MMTIILTLGILNLLFIIFQVLTGFHVIKVRIRIHRIIGIVLAVTALVHGIVAYTTHDSHDNEHHEHGHEEHSDR